MKIYERRKEKTKNMLIGILLFFTSLFILSCDQPNIKQESQRVTKTVNKTGTNKWRVNLLPIENNSVLVNFIAVDNKKLFAFTTKSILFFNNNKWEECYYNKDVRLGAGYTDGKVFFAAVTTMNSFNQSISNDRILYGELVQSNGTYSTKNTKIFESPFSENTYGFHSLGKDKIFMIGLCECAVLHLDKKNSSGNFKCDYFPILKNPASDFLLMDDNNTDTPIIHSKDAVYQIKYVNNKCELELLFSLSEPEMIPGKISYPFYHIYSSGNINFGLLHRKNKLFVYNKIDNHYNVAVFDSLSIMGYPKTSCGMIADVSSLDKGNIYCTLSDGRILHLMNEGDSIFNNLWEIICISTNAFSNAITVVNEEKIAIGNVSTAVLEKAAPIEREKSTNNLKSSEQAFLNPVDYYSTSSSYGIGIGYFINSFTEGLYIVDLYDLNKFNPVIDSDPINHYMKNESAIYGLQGRMAGKEGNSNNYEFDIGITAADVNEDGADDILISNLQGANSYYLNDGSGYFRDVTKSVGLDSNMYRSEGIITADVNNDGWLDVFSTSFLQTNRLFLNKGSNFIGYTKESGLTSNWGGISAQFADINNDGYPDLYVCNWIDENKLYLNLGNGKFRDITSESGTSCGYGKRSNCVVFADFDNDGLLDLFVGNRGTGNKLFKNVGNGKFINISAASGVDKNLFTYGAVAVDLDNDGLLDLAVTDKTGLYFYKNCLNKKKGIVFENVIKTWLQNPERLTANNIGLAAVDFDYDGDVDLILTQSPGSIIKIHNKLIDNSASHNFITVKVYGYESNKNGIGVKLSLYKDGELFGYREINGGSGYASCGSKVQHFGLGKTKGKYELTVEFPVSKIIKRISIMPGSQISVYEYEGSKELWQTTKKSIYRLMASGLILFEILKVFIAITFFWICYVLTKQIKKRNVLPVYFNYEEKHTNILFIIFIAAYLTTRILIAIYFTILPDHEAWINNSSNSFFLSYFPFILAAISLLISLPIIHEIEVKKLLSTHFAGKLIVKLQEFYHGESSAMNINRLGLYFKNYKELNPPDMEMIKRFNLVIEEFNTITSKDVIDVSNYGYNFIVINIIKTITDQVAHLRRQLISNVNSLKRTLDNCHKMINVDKNVITLDIAEKVISLIDSIKRDINNLREHINQNISCKLDDILSFVKEKFGTNNKYEINICGDIPPGTQICIPKKELEKILVIILQNAFEAYSEITLPLKVTITLSKKGNVILMEIQDYGTGIKKKI